MPTPEREPLPEPSSEQQVRLDALVTSFQKEILSGKAPRIEDYINVESVLRRPLLKKLLLVELLAAQDSRQRLSSEQYLTRFPHDQEIVLEIFKHVVSVSQTKGLGSTIDQPEVEPIESDSDEQNPDRLGRFLIKRKLGQGGFGVVYLAYDPKLERLVALKMPRPSRFRSNDHLTAILDEARKVANLKHPLLVSVYDIQEDAGLPFIVQEYIDGGDLASWSKANQPTLVQIARIFERIADALSVAHQRGLTHCDLKLSNILMDTSGTPHIADFGLAVHETLKELHRGRRFGTPPLMAPEQVRGEGHRLDGRTDIWALGVMMYQMLASVKPFTALNSEDLFEEILNLDPKPLRQIRRGVPRELERICLKCLSKRRTDRYSTAEDLRDDLNAWINQTDVPANVGSPTALHGPAEVQSDSTQYNSDSSLMIVPKGIRSFDANDSDFFLDLLPGPRHRDGLPESIRFWKKRIEVFDSEKAFSVGLIYGPSGCGKSSFIKAGLLPNLENKITTIYLIANSENTEATLLNQIRKRFPDLDENLGLVESLAEIRATENQGDRKLLLVIDQFEQWLHVHPATLDTELTRALRQCDGVTIQSLLLVRDDFYLAVNRLFQELEIDLQEGRNYSVVDLFDRPHARKLLLAIGRAYGKFDAEPSGQQERFLTHVIDRLAVDGKVICVRLALFCEMMKSRPFTIASLDAVGGMEGLGVTFLEEAFGRSAPPAYRAYEKPIRNVLATLLPQPGSDLKGSMCSQHELRHSAGFEINDQRFGEIIRILDSELRLITPTDPESRPNAPEGERYYQLTHDYMVPLLRQWLTRRKKESLRGRTELRLDELTSEWKIKPDSRRLPTLQEYLAICLLTRKRWWSETEHRMMQSAFRWHLARWGSSLVVVAIASAWLIHIYFAQIASHKVRQAEILVDALEVAPTEAVPYAISDLDSLSRYAVPILQKRMEEAKDNPKVRLRVAFGLARFQKVDHTLLLNAITTAHPNECANILSALRHDLGASIQQLRSQLITAHDAGDWVWKARIAICLFLLDETDVFTQMCQHQSNPFERTILISVLSRWHGEIGQLASNAARSSDDAVRTAVSLGLGHVATEELDQEMVRQVVSTLAGWYSTAPNAELHSAAGWALNKWKIPLPKIDSSTRLSRPAEWRINSLGMTMIQLPAPVAPAELPGSGSGRLWVCDREVSRALFDKFLEDAAYPAEKKPQNWVGSDERRSPGTDHPIQSVSWHEALMFCNWLSERDRLEPAYRKVDRNWQLNPEAAGYRLPFESEWEYACRAGTTTLFSCGDDETTLHDYAVYLANHTEPCGTKMPNAWGLFDMHGNVYEWCQNLASEGTTRRALRGGAFDYESRRSRSAFRTDNVPSYRSFTIGFRVFQQLDN